MPNFNKGGKIFLPENSKIELFVHRVYRDYTRYTFHLEYELGLGCGVARTGEGGHTFFFLLLNFHENPLKKNWVRTDIT